MSKKKVETHVQIGAQTRAVALAASTDEKRYVLNGIHFKGDKIEATNGMILLQAKIETVEAKELPTSLKGERLSDDVIIPTGSIESISKRVLKKNCLPILTKATAFKEKLAATDLETVDEIQYRAIDGRFPNTAQVLPTEDVKAVVSLSMQNLLMLAKVAKLLEASYVTLSIREADVPVSIKTVGKQGEVTGVVMPCRIT